MQAVCMNQYILVHIVLNIVLSFICKIWMKIYQIYHQNCKMNQRIHLLQQVQGKAELLDLSRVEDEDLRGSHHTPFSEKGGLYSLVK